jgi:hypothetical protein
MVDHFVAGGEFFLFFLVALVIIFVESLWYTCCENLKPCISQRSSPVQGNITRRVLSTMGDQRMVYCVDRATGSIQGKSFAANDVARIRVLSRRHARRLWERYRECSSASMNHTDVNLFVYSLFNDSFSSWCVALKDWRACSDSGWLVTSPSPRRLGFNPRQVCMCVWVIEWSVVESGTGAGFF